jgi:hypothetical protein
MIGLKFPAKDKELEIGLKSKTLLLFTRNATHQQRQTLG